MDINMPHGQDKMEVNTSKDLITENEFDALLELKIEHTPYFNALMYVIQVIIPRNQKYTGHAKDRDVFANFILDAQIQNRPVQEIFRQWISKKTARIMLNDGNYSDESFADSLRDLANYSLLYIGWLNELEVINHAFATAAKPIKKDTFPDMKNKTDDSVVRIKVSDYKGVVGSSKE